MSKQLLDKLLKETYNKDLKRKQLDLARGTVDRKGYHLIDISQEDIYSILLFNYIAIRKSKSVTKAQKQLKKEGNSKATRAEGAAVVAEAQDENSSRLRKECAELAGLVYSKFVQQYNTKIKDVEHQAKYEDGVIRVLQPRNQAYNLKDTLIAILKSNTADNLFKNFTKKQFKSFSRRTQFLHQGRTVGVQVVEDLSKLKANGDNLARDAAIEVFQEMLASVDWDWRLDDSYEGRRIFVKGKLGQNFANKPGEDSNDWTNLRPKLEEALAVRLQEKGFGTVSSQPFDERLAKHLVNDIVIEPIVKKKKTKGKPFKVEKPKNKRSPVPGAGGKRKKVRGGGLKTGGRSKRQVSSQKGARKAAPSYISLLGILNNKINEQVRGNMRAPRLENRTGRFANSVRVTDITTTREGFPSIGYTYRKNPYQTFEKGYAQGSDEKDPRKLIDRSIREIAGQLAIGRFYTRRV